jgi:thiol-disulfide isomerase/thioredoxin
MFRRPAFLFFLAIVLATGARAANPQTSGARASNPPLERWTTPQVLKLPQEADVVILNFWATWCVPCVEEMPIFVKVQKQHKNLKVIGISMDEPDRQTIVVHFLKQHPVNYRIGIWTGNDFEQMVNAIDSKWDGPIPATFIYQKGKRVFSKAGQITETELKRHLPVK